MLRGCINQVASEPNAGLIFKRRMIVKTEEIVKQLLEMSFDMDYMNYADYIEDSINTLTNELEKLKDNPLYELLENVVFMNGNEELPLLNNMLHYR